MNFVFGLASIRSSSSSGFDPWSRPWPVWIWNGRSCAALRLDQPPHDEVLEVLHVLRASSSLRGRPKTCAARSLGTSSNRRVRS